MPYATEESTDKCRTLCYEIARCNGATEIRSIKHGYQHYTESAMGCEYGPSELHTLYVKVYRITKHVLPYDCILITNFCALIIIYS